MTAVTVENAFEALMTVSEGEGGQEFTLPNGRSVVVFPADGMGALSLALEDPEFGAALRRAGAEFAAGEGGALDLDELLDD